MDFSNLTWLQFATIALAVTAADFVVSVLAAIVPPNYFSWSSVARVLDTHILKRVAPIAGLAFIAAALPAGSPEHAATYLAATAALALYAGETVRSLVTSYQVAKSAAADTPSIDLTNGPVPPDAPADDPLAGVPQ